MATDVNGASSEVAEAQKEKANESNPAAPTGDAQPKLSNKELKAKAKAEKAARRAQNKEVKPTPATPTSAQVPPASSGPSATDGKGLKSGKPKQDGAQHQQQQRQQQQPAQQASSASHPAHQRRPSGLSHRPSLASKEKDARSGVPECFGHIPMAKRISTTQANKDVHPAVLALGQQMATFSIRDSISRLEGTLLAFRKIIEEYETPEGDAMTRHFVSHVLNPQVEYLTECRPMSFAMGNAIRLLKAKIRKFDLETPQDEAKEGLLETVDDFIRERITLAEHVIIKNATAMVVDGDSILVFGWHRLVERTLLQSWKDGKRFEVHVVDDPYDQTGRAIAKNLSREADIRVSYTPNLAGLTNILRTTTKVILGTEAIFANGSLYGAVGTCDIAMAAKDLHVPVIALCETINIDHDRIAIDSLSYNEIDPERCSGDSFRLLFDTTPSSCVSVVVTEYESETGNAPPASILSILMKQEDPSAS